MSTAFTRPQINRDERMLWIHAGPHKAASSYVTERLRQNRGNLAAQGVLMDADDNCLANAIAEKRYEPVEEVLATLPSSCLLYTSPSPRDVEESRMPSSA